MSATVVPGATATAHSAEPAAVVAEPAAVVAEPAAVVAEPAAVVAEPAAVVAEPAAVVAEPATVVAEPATVVAEPATDAAAPDATAPDATAPDAAAPDATAPDATAPDATEPDATAPDATAPDATEPDATAPDASSEVEDAIQIANELLNQINAAHASAHADDASEFQSAIETVTDVLTQLKQLNTNTQNNNNNTPSSDAITEEPEIVSEATKCGLRSSLFSSADDSCYVQKELPPVQQMIKQAIYDDVSSAGTEVAANFLKAAGVHGVESAILTPETIKQINLLEKDPAMKTQITQFKSNLDAVVEDTVKDIEGKVEGAAKTVIDGVVQEGMEDVAIIPGVGALEAAGTAANVVAQEGEKIKDVQNKVTDTMSKINTLEQGLPQVPQIPDVAGVASQAAAGAANAASDATSKAAGDATAAVGDATSKAAGDATAAVGDATSKAAGDATAAAKKGGGYSRKRRHINKLSRRIERTLRRVQKKYGLQDKNSFLRRTLRREK
jgi:hypothetical protein